MNVKNIIHKRKSIRKYEARPLGEEALTQVQELLDNLTPLYRNIKMKGTLVEEGVKIQNISKGFIGSYGKIVAPHYIVVTSEEMEGYEENVGYAFEEVVLKLTDMGIGTCWIGGFINKALLKDIIEIPENQKPVIVIALGYPEDMNHFNIELTSSDKRKALDQIVQGELEDKLEAVFQSVRRAPSGVNLQPWRFIKLDDEIQCFAASENFITKRFAHFNRLDVGIALCHFRMASEELKVNYQFVKEDVQEEKGLEYIITIKLI